MKDDPQAKELSYKAAVGDVNIQINNGRNSAAKKTAQQLVSQVETNFGSTHPNMAIALLELASLQPDGSDTQIELFQKVLSIQEATYGTTSHEAASAHMWLAWKTDAVESNALSHLELAFAHLDPKEAPDAYVGMALALSDIQENRFDLKASMETRTMALAALEKNMITEPEYRLPLLLALASAYEDVGKYSEAETWYGKVVQAQTNRTVSITDELIGALRRLATIQYLQNKNAESRKTIAAALAASRSLYGADSVRTIGLLVDQATIEESQGNKDKAQIIREDISRLLASYSGNSKEEVLALMADPNLEALATAYNTQGNYEKAKESFQQILALREKKFGVQSPQLIDILNQIATLEQSLGNPKAAETIYGRIDSIVAAMPKDAVLPRISHLLTIGSFYAGELRVIKAEEAFKTAYSLAAQSYPVNDPIVDRCFYSLCDCYETQNKNAELEALLKARIATLASKLGQRNQDLASLHQQLASLYRTMGDSENAKTSFQEYMAILEDHIGEANAQTANTLLTMAEIYSAQGATTEAESVYSRLIPMYQKVYGFDHWRIGRCLLDLAGMQSDLVKAKSNYKRALEIYEKAFGTNHPFLIGVLENYAQVATASNDPSLANQLQARAGSIRKQNKVPVTQ
ncbi:MAG TPA: tetratricopeptide repeat protein [Kiritimatiellia bacterium]|nr:tetratricopeptide repeat protein [Kiritimatiellia bacterium]HMP35006.1 tetratricopeptide repeat protein [Kiritimatiellia bacterium]